MLAERGPIRWWREPGEAVLDLSAEPRDWERGFCLHHTWRPSLRSARGKWVAYRVHRWQKVARGWRCGLG